MSHELNFTVTFFSGLQVWTLGLGCIMFRKMKIISFKRGDDSIIYAVIMQDWIHYNCVYLIKSCNSLFSSPFL